MCGRGDIKAVSIGILLVLILFIPFRLLSLPLTETIYVIPEDEIELKFEEQFHHTGHNFRVERAGLGFGVISGLSIWFYTDFLHRGYREFLKNEIGDTHLKIFYYMYDFRDNSIHSGLLLKFRFPTGEDSYTNDKWREVAFGNNELILGPVIQMELAGSFFIHFNLFYLFREGEKDDLYEGFSYNLRNKDTYIKVFGFNPKSDDTFLNKEKVKNDFFIASLSINTNLIMPVVPYAEVRWTKRILKGEDVNEQEPLPINSHPLLVSSGIRYFITVKNYLGLYYLINPIDRERRIKSMMGFEVGLQF